MEAPLTEAQTSSSAAAAPTLADKAYEVWKKLIGDGPFRSTKGRGKHAPDDVVKAWPTVSPPGSNFACDQEELKAPRNRWGGRQDPGDRDTDQDWDRNQAKRRAVRIHNANPKGAREEITMVDIAHYTLVQFEYNRKGRVKLDVPVGEIGRAHV